MLKELTVQLPEEVVARLETLAAENNLSVSELLLKLLPRYNLYDRPLNGVAHSYRLDNYVPGLHKMTPEEEATTRQVLAEMEAFVDDIERSNGDKEPFDAVEAVREGRSRY